MVEILQKDGTWAFEGDAIRIVPGWDKGVHAARQTLGELTVPLTALAGISFEPGRKGGRLRLQLRRDADPLSRATGGRMPDAADPYQLTVDASGADVAGYLVDEVRQALLLDQVPSGPVDRYLVPGPAVPLSVSAGDGTVHFDGELVRLEWNWKTDEDKRAAGPTVLPLAEIRAVEWRPSAGLENGCLRFTTAGGPSRLPAKRDPHAVELYGFKKDPLMALVAAAVTARLPHPSAGSEPAASLPASSPVQQLEGSAPAAPAAGPGADHDTLLRRLRELGELHHAGVLTDEEFTAAKQAILRRF